MSAGAQDKPFRASTALWLSAVLGGYLLALLLGASGWISTAVSDAETIEKLAQSFADSGLGDSYAIMARIYAWTSASERVGIEVVAGLLFIVACMAPLRTHRTLALAAFWLIGPTVFFLTQFDKETVLVFFVVGAAIVLRSRLPDAARVGLVLLIYAAYAAIFRNYYFLIAGVFLVLAALRRMPPLVAVSVLLFLTAGLILAPSHVFEQLQSSRDAFNLSRIGVDAPGARTAFSNPCAPTDLIHFVCNYAYATVRLNLPFFWGGSFRDGYMFVVALSWALACAAGLQGGRTTYDNAALFLAHVAVCICFEPDVGSYLRHVSSALPYLSPALAWIERRPSHARLWGAPPPQPDPA